MTRPIALPRADTGEIVWCSRGPRAEVFEAHGAGYASTREAVWRDVYTTALYVARRQADGARVFHPLISGSFGLLWLGDI